MTTNELKKILIVDDEAYVRLLIEQSLEELEDAGVKILTANNGEEAIQLVQEEQPQMVFLDVMMPKMNGFEVCRMIKRELALENIYVVMLTAKGQENDRQESEQAGANLYMTKPFDPDELLKLAESVLGT